VRICDNLVVLPSSLILQIVLLGSVTQAGVAPPYAADRSRDSAGRVTVAEGLLTVQVVDAPLEEVLRAVARESGVTISLETPVPGKRTDSFRALPLDEGLRRLLRGANFTFFYGVYGRTAPDGGGSSEATLRQVRVFAVPGNAALPELPRVRASVARRRGQAQTPAAKHSRSWRDDERAVEALSAVLAEDEDGQRRADAAAALGRTWSPDAVDPLSEAILDDEDSAVRRAAGEALGRTWSDDAVDPLALALLGDEDPIVREEAALALGETWSDAAVEPLTEALLEDPHWSVRDRAARALGEIGSTDAVESLRRALQDQDSSVRESTELALAAIGHP
jgi:hypothetical protein